MENNVFDHFVITRFNLKNKNWNHDKEGNVINNEKWLEERYFLFKEYCFPSLKNQSLKSFKWLVYFDVNTPEKYKHENQKLRAHFSNFFPLYAKDFDSFENSLCEDINKLKNKKNSYLLTTRIDNDDCFHKDAIKVIQKNFNLEDRAIIDLRKGLTLKIDRPRKLSFVYKESGPFISLISKIDSKDKFPTVYDRKHTNWSHDTKFIIVDDDYFWLQLIHKRNISNSLGGNFTSRKEILKGFGLDTKIRFSISYYFFVAYLRAKRKIKKF